MEGLEVNTSSSRIITNTGYLDHKHVPRVVVVIVRHNYAVQRHA